MNVRKFNAYAYFQGMNGMFRICGSTTKPDPLMFIQVYRLLCFYSLVKPPKGSNVEGTEIFKSLLAEEDFDVPGNSAAEWETFRNNRER